MIIWLASYPKSGNTWIRLFLDSLFNSSEEFNINKNIIKQFPLRSNFIGISENINNQNEFAKHCIAAQQKINLDNEKVFYSRFLIPKKSRINLVPINFFGKIDLESYKINLDKVYFEDGSNKKELDEEKLLLLQERINEIFSQNSLNNILKYSNLRKIIQSFFN